MPEGTALVVGGTGMLRKVSRTLALDRTVAVVSRGGERLDSLVAKSPNVIPVAVDWHKTRELERALWKVVDEHGAFSLCVAWIHSDAPEAPAIAAQFVRGRYYHVLPCEAAGPEPPDAGRRARFEAVKGVEYHEVLLGWVPERTGSRWLNNEEISRGVLTAIAWAKKSTIVGKVRPWEARPG